jgi:hypothetical protein
MNANALTVSSPPVAKLAAGPAEYEPAEAAPPSGIDEYGDADEEDEDDADDDGDPTGIPTFV